MYGYIEISTKIDVACMHTLHLHAGVSERPPIRPPKLRSERLAVQHPSRPTLSEKLAIRPPIRPPGLSKRLARQLPIWPTKHGLSERPPTNPPKLGLSEGLGL